MVKRLLSEPPLRYTLSSTPEERKNKGEGKEKGEENEMKWGRRKRENKRSGEREKKLEKAGKRWWLDDRGCI